MSTVGMCFWWSFEAFEKIMYESGHDLVNVICQDDSRCIHCLEPFTRLRLHEV